IRYSSPAASPGCLSVERSASSRPSGENANDVAAATRTPSSSSGRSPPFGGGGPRAAIAPAGAKEEADVPAAISRATPETGSIDQSCPPATDEARAARRLPSGDHATACTPASAIVLAPTPTPSPATNASSPREDHANARAAPAIRRASPVRGETQSSPSPSRKRHAERKASWAPSGENAYAPSSVETPAPTRRSSSQRSPASRSSGTARSSGCAASSRNAT